MRKTAMTQQAGKIPTQLGPDEAVESRSSVVAGPGGASVQAAVAGPGEVPGEAEHVIPGAGPTLRPGERPTVRLRDAGPDDPPRYAPEWLELREGADAAARAVELLDPLRIRLANLPGKAGIVVHDLGCGTGSMGRWLAPAWTAPSTGSCTTATPTSCTSPPWPHRAPAPTAAASRPRPVAVTSAGSPRTPWPARPW